MAIVVTSSCWTSPGRGAWTSVWNILCLVLTRLHKSILHTSLNRHRKDHLGSHSNWVIAPAQFLFLQHLILWCQLVWSHQHNRLEQLAPKGLVHTSKVPCLLPLNHLRFVPVAYAPILTPCSTRPWHHRQEGGDIHGYPGVQHNNPCFPEIAPHL